MSNTSFRAALLASLVATGACTVQQHDIPSLAGPSGFAMSLLVQASPDVITQNGSEQSVIVVTARGGDGQGVAGVAIRLDMEVGGVPQDFGTLSQRNLITGSDGRATSVYTAPAAPPVNLGGAGTLMTIVATPVGANQQAGTFSSASIRLVPPGVILPPAETPRPDFTVSPSTAVANSQVVFDASTSCAGFEACTSPAGIASFSWSFGDGSTGSGQTVTHSYALAGTYAVTLTVVNDRGIAASVTKSVTVGSSAAPTATIVVSPSDISVSDTVFFTATNITPGNGRTIESLTWNFGDGSPTQSGTSVTHQFVAANTYTVVLTIVDDIGQTTTLSRGVTVDP